MRLGRLPSHRGHIGWAEKISASWTFLQGRVRASDWASMGSPRGRWRSALGCSYLLEPILGQDAPYLFFVPADPCRGRRRRAWSRPDRNDPCRACSARFVISGAAYSLAEIPVSGLAFGDHRRRHRLLGRADLRQRGRQAPGASTEDLVRAKRICSRSSTPSRRHDRHRRTRHHAVLQRRGRAPVRLQRRRK